MLVKSINDPLMSVDRLLSAFPLSSMKPKKKKLDIKAFFINHCDKMVLVMVIPLAIYIGLQGTKFEPLPWQPEALKKAADDADNHIKSNERKAVDEGVSITTYDVKAEWIKAKIHSDLYRTDVKWMPSLFPEKMKRGAVEVFGVTDLKSNSGLGAVAINSSSPVATALGVTPGSNYVGRRWAVITGLIPVKKQLDLYVSSFSSSVYTAPDRDTPAYYFYDVERAEILPGSNPANLEWKKLSVFDAIKKDQLLWAGMAADPVDPTFLAPLPTGQAIPMAYPLPPVAKRFGEEVTHPPVIPMLTDSQMESTIIQEQMQKKFLKELLDFDEGTILKKNPFGTAQTVVEAEQLKKQREAEDIPLLTVTDYLFRFFDFTVEIGKTYRYRVRLYLANPNVGLGASLLEDAVLSKEPYLTTEFSTPSNQVTIPLGARILTSATFAPSQKSPWAEPACSLYAVYFDMTDGSEWYVEKERVFRGQTVNYTKAELTSPAKAVSPSSLDGLSSPPPPPPSGSGSGRTSSRRTAAKAPAAPAAPAGEKKTIDVVSEVCVLDILGGAVLPKTNPIIAEQRSPGKVVVLEPSGALILRKIDVDLLDIERMKNPVPASGGGGFPGMGLGSDSGMGPSGM